MPWGHGNGGLAIWRRGSEAAEKRRNSYCGLFLIPMFGPVEEEVKERGREVLCHFSRLTVPPSSPSHSLPPPPPPSWFKLQLRRGGYAPQVALYPPRSKSQLG